MLIVSRGLAASQDLSAAVGDPRRSPVRRRSSASVVELGVALATLGLLVLWPRVTKAVPAPLVAIGLVTVAVVVVERAAPGLHVAAIGSRFQHDQARVLPEGVAVYEIAGPLFFGAAQRAMGAIETAGAGARALVLALGTVPVIDATGLVALESAIDRLRSAKKLVVIAGPLPEPRAVFQKANLEVAHEHVFLAGTLEEGITLARDLLALTPDAASSGHRASATQPS